MRTFAVLLAALALVAVASAARTATVTVRDASLAPARVRVDAGGSVTRRNAGARSPRIASQTGAFAAFPLARGARKTVSFTRNGTHADKRCGVVFVSVALGPGCTGAQGGGTAPPPPGMRTYTYNVVVRGSFKNEGYVNGSTGRRESTWTHAYAWSTTFTKFKFKVITAGTKFLGVNATGSAVASTARVTQKWDWLFRPRAARPASADCEGALTGVVRSELLVSNSTLSTPNYRVASQVPGGWDKRSEIEARCSNQYPPPEQTTPFTMADGTRVDLSTPTLQLVFQRNTGSLRNPASALANGRSFTIDTGVKTSQKPSCEGDCSGKVKIAERYIAIFTRRP